MDVVRVTTATGQQGRVFYAADGLAERARCGRCI